MSTPSPASFITLATSHLPSMASLLVPSTSLRTSRMTCGGGGGWRVVVCEVVVVVVVVVVERAAPCLS
jgi:hypothetical protein